MFYGKTQEIADLMKEIQFTPTQSGSSDYQAYYYVDQVQEDQVNSQGLLASENPPTNFSAGENNDCGTSFNPAADGATCTGACQFKYRHELAKTTLKGQLFHLNEDGTRNTSIHNGVSVSAYQDGSTLVGTGTLLSGGIFTIADIPVNPNADSIYQVKVEDANNVFLDDTFDVVVPAGAETETSAGKKRLLTADGKVCTQTDTDCISNQSPKQGKVLVHVINAETGENVEGSTVTLRNGQSSTGSVNTTATTDDKGIATFENLDYGYYTAESEQTADVNFASSRIDLNGDEVSKKLTLIPSNSEYDMLLEMDVDQPDADFDLKLYA
jgi:hypothetical protein